MPIELIPSVTGIKYTNGDGYYFRLSQKLHNKLYLNCQVRSCRVRGNIPANYDKHQKIVCKGVHNHPADFYEAEFCDLERRILDRSATEVLPLRRIFLEETTGASPRAVNRLNYPSFLRRMQRRRQFTKRSIPRSLADFSNLMLSKDFIEFSHINGQQFFISEIGNHSVLFISPVMRELLRVDDQAYSVYQFRKFVCQSLKQIMIITKIYNNVAFPVAYIGMQLRTDIAYKEVFQRLQEEEPLWNPLVMYAGTEPALCSALVEVFENCRVTNSWFHFAQEIRKEIRNLDLLNLLHSELSFYTCIQLIELLPLLPPDRFEEGFNSIKSKINRYLAVEGVAQLLDYINDNWLQGSRAEDLSLINDPTKSNVELKLLNRQLMHSIRGNTRQDAIWSFTRSLVVIERKYSDAYIDLQSRGTPPKWTGNCSFKTQEKKIRNAVLRFYNSKTTVEKYLDDVSRTTVSNTLDLNDDGDIEFADDQAEEEDISVQDNEEEFDINLTGGESYSEYMSDTEVVTKTSVKEEIDFDEFIVEEVEEQEYSDNESFSNSGDSEYFVDEVSELNPSKSDEQKDVKDEKSNAKQDQQSAAQKRSTLEKVKNRKLLLVFNSESSSDTNAQEIGADCSDIVHNCVICKKNLYCYACQPCGHLCLCDTCCEEFVNKKCPMCSKKSMWVQRIYLPHPLN